MSDGPRHAESFDENDYARPNQPFRCGWADEGRACPMGPTKRGMCRSAYECAPYQLEDTWNCARTKAGGGPCQEGPLPDGTCCRPIQPCAPMRSVLSQRGVLSFCVSVAAAGIALIMLGLPQRNAMVSPGKLSAHHRQLQQRCQACHVAGEGNLSDLIHASFDGQTAAQQSQLCLDCHRELGNHPLQPHGTPRQALASLVSKSDRGEPSLATRAGAALFGSPADAHAELACALCHTEHHGDVSLSELTNQQCQSCHTNAFDSFEVGHPEFDNYVSSRRTRIDFDHQSHYGLHFQAEAETAKPAGHTCVDCHALDQSGQSMRVTKFSQSCAGCHQDQIEDDTSPGALIFAYPVLDIATLREKSVAIGDWPAAYPLHVRGSGRLVPLAKLLLLADD
ncbi:MAG: hypothetical protein MI861_09955, partial [Pirellulales bacterium]|nr:hypothetical protein [Pirellulales bacterium]